MNNPLYIIPARGGSKGIPHKNIVPLAGKPLLAYTIEAARAAGASDERIILSTDDQEIANVARDCGLPVSYMRPAALATDTAGTREVILDVLEWAEAHGLEYDSVVLLQPTSPLRTGADIRGCIEMYNSDLDMVVSVAEAASNPYYTCYEPDSEGFLHISKGDGMYTRRQDCPPVFEYNGAVYVINPASIRREPLGAFAKRMPYVMPKDRSMDIDSPIDIVIAEALLKSGKYEV